MADPIYTAEKIIAVRYTKDGHPEYLIKWKNYTSKDNTWEPIVNILDRDLITAFENSSRNKRGSTSRLSNGRKKRGASRSSSSFKREVKTESVAEQKQQDPEEIETTDNHIESQQPVELAHNGQYEPEDVELEPEQKVEKPADPEPETQQAPILDLEEPLKTEPELRRVENPEPKEKILQKPDEEPEKIQKEPSILPEQQPQQVQNNINNSHQLHNNHQQPQRLKQELQQKQQPAKQQPTKQQPTKQQPTKQLPPKQQPPKQEAQQQTTSTQNQQLALKKKALYAILVTVVTDVTVNNHTITITESKTNQGFFKDKYKL